jgi:hypothetical protein
MAKLGQSPSAIPYYQQRRQLDLCGQIALIAGRDRFRGKHLSDFKYLPG